ncbi:MAG: YCF48-related protein [Nibricoccus sp.]
MLKRLLTLFVFVVSSAFAADPAPGSHGLLLDAASPDGRTIIAVGENGRVLRSADSGRTWELLPSPATSTLTGVSFADARNGWAVGHDGVILVTRDGGLSWTQQFSDKALSFLQVYAPDSRHAYAVGAFGAFYETDNAGETWTVRKAHEEDVHLNSIIPLTKETCLIAGERGTLLKFSTTNSAFTLVPSSYEGSFFGALVLGDDIVLAFGLRGRVFRSEDLATTWQPITLERPALIQTGVKLKSGTIVLAGQARAFFVSKNNGRTFQAWDAGITTAVAKLLEAPDGTLLALGEAGATRLKSPDQTAP